MKPLALNDTIVAVSSAWAPASLGIVRLSGSDSFALLQPLGASAPATFPTWTCHDLRLDADTCLPSTIQWFRAPRSYTGQDIVEVHTVGCLPLLRELSSRLIELGARRALPGEFTARAFMSGKLDADQVEGILNLMQAERESGLREAARLAGHGVRDLLLDLRERLTSLLALIEAGVDFVEEEDIRFVTAAEVARRIDQMLGDISRSGFVHTSDRRAGKLHVALVGLPNAGKSRLFNALIGRERAIVSPVIGTTRDVLSAEVELGDVSAVVQDCAGLGGTRSELELATHIASERTAQHADLVLWVQAVDVPWDRRATEVCETVALERRVLVSSKSDLPVAALPAGLSFSETIPVSAATGAGIDDLRRRLALFAQAHAPPALGLKSGACLAELVSGLRRAREVTDETAEYLDFPELVALELRHCLEIILDDVKQPLDEALLDRVFGEFCVGK
jgi:tRNA modification GTPase